MASGLPATPPTALAPGFRFHPSDEELVQYYLKRKVCGKAIAFDAIAEVDIYKKEPWNLGGESKLKSRDMEWYFFSALDRKYGNGGRVNRATSYGYWKATGNDRSVLHGSRIVGMKKTLVFHSGRAPGGQRTNWIMHEYRLVDDELVKALRDSYVVCRVFLKSEIGPPHKDRYAPFIEEEWDDDKTGSSQGGKSVDEAIVDSKACIEESDLEQDAQSTTLRQSEHLKNSGSVLSLSPSERLEDCPLTCTVNKESTIFPNKRSRHDDLNPQHSDASESSLMTIQECTITKKISRTPPATFDISDGNATLPPSYLKYITYLEDKQWTWPMLYIIFPYFLSLANGRALSINLVVNTTQPSPKLRNRTFCCCPLYCCFRNHFCYWAFVNL
ncbi:unnamed protein product, partial [Vitis vinifera]